ncbi:hypothetical protein N7456_000914 [Penicillium angulare]|uniref:DUF7702 domain-containing protein n=1 Tax=Penicillium angulare TaxID=116970 RepID=A0A9W9KSS3_9EURO|nr:hypothetical protein N7456_000914 [Penicillium angulare]
MNGIFIADVIVYLILLPVANYLFIKHRWTGFLAWYFVNLFCLARIAGGALGVHDSSSMTANIIQSVGITPLILAADGLTHEARAFRFKNRSSLLSWSVVSTTTIALAAAMILSVTGSLNIFEGHGSSLDLIKWKVGSGVTVLVWASQVLWAVINLVRKGKGYGAGHPESTLLLQGTLGALVFIGIRVIYTLVAVLTQNKDLSPITGTMAVRVVLMFLPECAATLIFVFVGLKTRHIRDIKKKVHYESAPSDEPHEAVVPKFNV